MLTLNPGEVSPILRDFGILSPAAALTELQRYDYESQGPDTREVRLILRVETGDGRSLVLRLKNEPDAPQALMEAQSRFAALLSILSRTSIGRKGCISSSSRTRRSRLPPRPFEPRMAPYQKLVPT